MENDMFAENECDDSCRRPPIRYKKADANKYDRYKNMYVKNIRNRHKNLIINSIILSKIC